MELLNNEERKDLGSFLSLLTFTSTVILGETELYWELECFAKNCGFSIKEIGTTNEYFRVGTPYSFERRFERIARIARGCNIVEDLRNERRNERRNGHCPRLNDKGENKCEARVCTGESFTPMMREDHDFLPIGMNYENRAWFLKTVD